MTRFLFDLNVLLDVLLDREPHAATVARLWAAVERGGIEGFLPAHGVTTVHYLAESARDARFASGVVADLLEVFEVVPVDEVVLRKALSLGWRDFEDAVCAACAVAAKCDAIVTRDPTGFRRSPVPVVDPAAVLAWLTQS